MSSLFYFALGMSTIPAKSAGLAVGLSESPLRFRATHLRYRGVSPIPHAEELEWELEMEMEIRNRK